MGGYVIEVFHPHKRMLDFNGAAGAVFQCLRRQYLSVCHAHTVAVGNEIKFPCIVPVHLGFDTRRNVLGDEKEGMIFHLGQCIGNYCIVLIKLMGALFLLSRA